MADTPSESSSGLSFLQVAKFSSAFACGVMGGFLYSLKQVNPSLQLEFSLGTILMAVLSAGLALFLWKLVTDFAMGAAVKDGSDAGRRKFIALIIGGLLLFSGMFVSYFYAIKDIRRAAFLQVMQGTTLALVVVGGIGVIVFRLARMLNRNEPPTGSTGLPESQDSADSPPHE
ncbi:MAG: hypothetical protein JNN07_06800 [Verrucomicrobiales bacterium]|nr:hypothetical protein [Verrucomicrobiales bacterium]